MTILGIPDIVVLELVHVHLERVIGIEVHIGDKEMSNEPSMPPSFEYSQD